MYGKPNYRRSSGPSRPPMRNMGPIQRPYYRPMPRSGPFVPFVPQLPFDLIKFQSTFDSFVDEKGLTDALLRRYQALLPTPAEKQSLSDLLGKIIAFLDGLVFDPTAFAKTQIDEVKIVGSYKKDTMIFGHNTADLVILIHSLPKRSISESLSQLLSIHLEQIEQFPVVCDPTPFGFVVKKDGLQINVYITSRFNSKLEDEECLSTQERKLSLYGLQRTRWFEEFASHMNIKVIVRILKDLSKRLPGFNNLTSWIIDLLAHHVVVVSSRQQVISVSQAFRRVLHLLAAGLFLPGCAGVIDPCHMGNIRVHTSLQLPQQDELCCVSHLLLRLMAYGQYDLFLNGTDFLKPGALDDLLASVSLKTGIAIRLGEPINLEQRKALDSSLTSSINGDNADMDDELEQKFEDGKSDEDLED